jgi:hypothetical protein
MKQYSLFLALGCVAGCALSSQASVDINADITPAALSVYQTPASASSSNAEYTVPVVVVPESSHFGWAGASFLLVCGLATTLGSSYRKATWN